ncbi:MAG TPA: hypothetical protein VHV83_03880 [Armatimonadota bacterium]|nr:hypothetical protein [Armatimonadota bacterium]
MSDGIFLLNENGNLVEMTEQAYDSEALLQQLLAEYPSLLAGKQINPGAPRRWLLVRREAGVPAEEAGGNRWSVDHLFLDQEGIPTLVEVKRSTDTRIRREVVGQMLDYAANAVVYWPLEQIHAYLDATCQEHDIDPDQAIMDLLGDDTDVEQYWQSVKTNLQAGRIRMIFVADLIPPELRRIIEFLNEQMNPAEVLAVEIKQFAGQGLKTLVPRVMGQTAEAQQKKSAGISEKGKWDEVSFMEALLANTNPDCVAVARRLLEWGRQRMTRVWWGEGKRSGSFVPILEHGGQTHYVITAWTSGSIEIGFQWMKSRPPFMDEAKRRELLQRLNAIPGIMLPDDSITRRPNISLSAFVDPKVLFQFFAVLDWFLGEITTV